MQTVHGSDYTLEADEARRPGRYLLLANDRGGERFTVLRLCVDEVAPVQVAGDDLRAWPLSSSCVFPDLAGPR